MEAMPTILRKPIMQFVKKLRMKQFIQSVLELHRNGGGAS